MNKLLFGTETVQRLNEIIDRNEKVTKSFNALSDVIHSVKNYNRYNLKEPENNFREIYNWCKANKKLYSTAQWNVVQDKVREMKEELETRKQTFTTPAIQKDSERPKKSILSTDLLELGNVLASSDLNFSQCLRFADDWLAYYSWKGRKALSEKKTIIMNRCMSLRHGRKWVWLYYGNKEYIPEQTLWKHYSEMLDSDGNYIVPDEAIDEYAKKLSEREREILNGSEITIFS